MRRLKGTPRHATRTHTLSLKHRDALAGSKPERARFGYHPLGLSLKRAPVLLPAPAGCLHSALCAVTRFGGRLRKARLPWPVSHKSPGRHRPRRSQKATQGAVGASRRARGDRNGHQDGSGPGPRGVRRPGGQRLCRLPQLQAWRPGGCSASHECCGRRSASFGRDCLPTIAPAPCSQAAAARLWRLTSRGARASNGIWPARSIESSFLPWLAPLPPCPSAHRVATDTQNWQLQPGEVLPATITVDWQLSLDREFSVTSNSGSVEAGRELHSGKSVWPVTLHLEALHPGTIYYFRFFLGSETSTVGSFATPGAGAGAHGSHSLSHTRMRARLSLPTLACCP